MLISQAGDVRRNSAANSLPPPIRRPKAAQNSATGRLAEIASNPLIYSDPWVPEGRFLGVKSRFFPAGSEMRRGRGPCHVRQIATIILATLVGVADAAAGQTTALPVPFPPPVVYSVPTPAPLAPPINPGPAVVPPAGLS